MIFGSNDFPFIHLPSSCIYGLSNLVFEIIEFFLFVFNIDRPIKSVQSLWRFLSATDSMQGRRISELKFCI